MSSAKQQIILYHVISKGNLVLVLDPLQIPPGPNSSGCPSGLVLRPGARRAVHGRDNPKPRGPLQREILNIFHFQLCVIWMEMMQLAPADAVWGCAFAGVSRNTGAVLLFPAFGSGANAVLP